MAGTASGRSPQIRMALTAAKTMQGRSLHPTCCAKRSAPTSMLSRGSPTTTPTVYSQGWTILSSRVRRSPTSTISEPYWLQKGVEFAPLTERENHCDAWTFQFVAGDDQIPVRCRRRYVPAEFQPWDSRRSQEALSGGQGCRTGCWPSHRNHGGSARSQTAHRYFFRR